ncbi:MAG: hypothetical protein ACREJ2_05785 [Planctomycetota bacterium]
MLQALALAAVCGLTFSVGAEDWNPEGVEQHLRAGDIPAAQRQVAAEYQRLVQNPCTNAAVIDACDALRLTTLVKLFSAAPWNGPDGATLRGRILDRPDLQNALAVTLTSRDQPAQVSAVIESLGDKLGDTALSEPQLLTAFACVWDHPPQNTWYRTELTPDGIAAAFKRDVAQMPDSERQRPARVLTFLAYSALSPADWAYVDQFYTGARDNPARAYTDIRYDTATFTNGAAKVIDSHAYTLANIRRYGGVCIEQAYHARGVCHALGIPAVILAGAGGSGIGHAWMGYLKPGDSGKLTWDFTVGTTPEGNFTVGEFEDPQNNTIMTNLELSAEMPELSLSADDRRRAAAAAAVIAAHAQSDTTFSAQVPVWARIAFDMAPTHRATWNSLLEYIEKVPGANNGQIADIVTVLAKLGHDHPGVMLHYFDRLHDAVEHDGQVFDASLFAQMKAAVAGNQAGELEIELRLAQQEASEGHRDRACARLLKIVQTCPRGGIPVLSAADELARLWREDHRDDRVLPMYLDLLAANKLTSRVSAEVMSMTMYFHLSQRVITEYNRLGRTDNAKALTDEVQKFIGH